MSENGLRELEKIVRSMFEWPHELGPVDPEPYYVKLKAALAAVPASGAKEREAPEENFGNGMVGLPWSINYDADDKTWDIVAADLSIIASVYDNHDFEPLGSRHGQAEEIAKFITTSCNKFAAREPKEGDR